MRTRSTIIVLLLATTVMLPLAGCGDNDNSENGNGNDNGGGSQRTPTPVRTSTPLPPTATPVGPGETVTPTEQVGVTATATPAGPSATPTTGGTPVPTNTPTGGAACVTGEHIMVTASLDKAFAAFAMTLAYPVNSVNIPGSGPSLGNRVVFNVSGGLSTSSDDDDIGDDGVDDTLHASFVSSVANDPGDVFTVTFDCVAGQAKPAAGAFTCTVVSASTPDADTIPDEVCTLEVR